QDLPAPHDHGAVMQRRARHEDRGEELRGELAVHRNTGLAVVLQTRRPLENDESAVLGLADEKCGSDQLVDDPLELLLAAGCEKPVERTELADLAERASQLRLKDDDERDKGHGEEGLQEKG